MFKQIDPSNEQPQSLLDWTGFRTYNFDVIDGVQYQFDITKPARYDGDCKLINAQSERVINLTYQGKPVDPKAEFLIATNNYRAYSAKFPGTGDSHIVFAAPDENRQILANYISSESKTHGQVNPSADKNWRIAPITSKVKLISVLKPHQVKKQNNLSKRERNIQWFKSELTKWDSRYIKWI